MQTASTPATASKATTSTAPENLSDGFFRARGASIAVSAIGLVMSSFSLAVLVRKYMARRDVFDVGLIILEASQVIYCLLCSVTFSFDITVQLLGTYGQEPFRTIYEALFALVLIALLNRNQWTMCMTLFRTVAATNPITFRHCFTKRMQLLVFGGVFSLSLLIGVLYFPGVIQQLDQKALLVTSRIFQSYIPVPVILVCSIIMAYKFCRSKDHLAGGGGGAASAATAVTGGGSGQGPAVAAGSASGISGDSIIGSTRGNGGVTNLRRNSRVATAIVLCLSVSFHLLETPGAVLIMLNLSLTSSVDWFYALNDTLVSLDSAVHFIIFFCLSRNFRRTAAQACRKQRPRFRGFVLGGRRGPVGRGGGVGGGGGGGIANRSPVGAEARRRCSDAGGAAERNDEAADQPLADPPADAAVKQQQPLHRQRGARRRGHSFGGKDGRDRELDAGQYGGGSNCDRRAAEALQLPQPSSAGCQIVEMALVSPLPADEQRLETVPEN